MTWRFKAYGVRELALKSDWNVFTFRIKQVAFDQEVA
jgi:hypothetical protein